MNTSRYTLLTIGKTHTGKTTLANELAPQIPRCVVLETDPIALFLKSSFTSLHTLDLDHSGGFSSPSLKFLVFKTILTFALEENFNIIMSNSNMFENGRKDLLKIIKNYPGKIIGIYLNYSEEILSERIKKSDRDINVLRTSKDFGNLLINQRTRFQPPNYSDFDYYFEVKDPNELPNISTQIFKIFNS
ncbi:MAG: AAA family ATPase [Patescibacteria group bacterium]